MKYLSKVIGLVLGLSILGISMPKTPARGNTAVSVDYNTVVRTLDPNFNGVNYVSFWDTLQGDTAGREALRRSGAKLLRFPGGTPASYTDWANPYQDNWSYTSTLDLWNYARQIGMTPLYETCATTLHNNDPSGAHAADFISYCMSNGINAPLIEVDNEPDNGMPSADDYPYLQWYFDAFNAQSAAMKARNPDLKVMGPAGTNVYFWWALDSLNMFKTQCDSNADAISLHYYESSMAAAEDWVADMGFIRSVTSKPLYVTEWNAGGGTGDSDKTAGLMVANADMVGAFAKTGVTAHCFYGSVHGVQDNWGILAGAGDYRAAETPTPTYFMLPLWAKMGDKVLNVTNPADAGAVLSVWSHKKSDGSVQVMLINKTSAQTVDLSFFGFNPAGKTVNVYECKAITGNVSDWDIAYNNVITPSVSTTDLPGPLTETVAGSTYTRTLPSVSITVLDFQSGPSSVPSAPTGLIATAGGAEIALFWNPSPGAVSYNLKRATTSGGPYTLVATTNTNGYLNTGLTDNTTYYYVVTATNTAGASGNSSQASAKPVVQIPRFFIAKAGIGQVLLTWYAAPGATSYNVKRATVSGGPYAMVANAATANYLNTGLTNGITYYYVVSAVDAIGESANAREASAIPTASIAINCGGLDVLPFVADIDANAGTGAISNSGAVDLSAVTNPAPVAVYQSERYGTFTYTIPALTPSAAYRVRLHFTEDYFTGAGQRLFNVTINGASVLTNFDIFAVTGAQHKAVVREFIANADSNGQVAIDFPSPNGKIDGIEVIPTTATLPGTPTGLAGAGWASQISLSWSYVSGATSYNVKRSTISGGPYATVGSPAAITFTNTGLTNGVTYYYVVSAVNSVGESGNSNQVSAAPNATPTFDINAGGGASSPFVADTNFSGGSTGSNTATIDTTAVTNPAPIAVYQSERYGTFVYTVPGLTPSTPYSVRLHFTEDYWTAAGQRVFNVTINGTPALTNFDIMATAGAQHKVTIQQLSTTVNSSGQVVIAFAPTATSPDQSAKVDGIEVLPAGGPPPPTIPAPPVGLTATAGNAQVALSWSASSGATSYNVKRATVTGGPYTAIASGVTGTTYTNTGLTNGATYFYVVTAVNTAGESGNSNQASATPASGVTIPTAPTLQTAMPGNALVTLTFTTVPGATSYNLKSATAAGGPYVTDVTGVAGTGSTITGIDPNQQNGVLYWFVVSALNSAGESINSNALTATPAAPSNGSVVVAINSGGGAAGAFIADNYMTGGSPNSVTSTVDTTGVTNPAPQSVYQSERFGAFSYTIPGLTAGTSYTVRLHFAEIFDNLAGKRLINVGINGAQVLTSFDIFTAAGGFDKAIVREFPATANSSGQIIISVAAAPSSPDQLAKISGIEIVTAGPPPPIPAPPAGLTATAGNTQVALSWTASSGATSYNVKRGTATGGPYATVAPNITTTSYTNTGLTNGAAYFYVVTAVNTNGESGNSSEASAMPISGGAVPAAPKGVAARAGNAQVTVTWVASTGATSYGVLRSTISNGPYTAVGSPTAVTYTDTGLTNGTTYYYVVTASNASGTSPNSTKVSATPIAPISVNAGGPAVGAFLADTGFVGGASAANWAGIVNTSGVSSPAPQAVYQTERNGNFTYTIGGLPANSSRRVRLHFTEDTYTGSNQRRFNVAINGHGVLTNFDLYGTAGGQHKAVVREFITTASSAGQVVIQFTGVVQAAKVDGIEVQ